VRAIAGGPPGRKAPRRAPAGAHSHRPCSGRFLPVRLSRRGAGRGRRTLTRCAWPRTPRPVPDRRPRRAGRPRSGGAGAATGNGIVPGSWGRPPGGLCTTHNTARPDGNDGIFLAALSRSEGGHERGALQAEGRGGATISEAKGFLAGAGSSTRTLSSTRMAARLAEVNLPRRFCVKRTVPFSPEPAVSRRSNLRPEPSKCQPSP
jgi:hypothetical protein